MRIAVLGTSLLLLVTAPGVTWAKGKAVTCEDGTKSKAGQGACSHHGGVAEAKKTDKAERKSRSTKVDRPETKSRAERSEKKEEEKGWFDWAKPAERKGRSAPDRRGPRAPEREGQARARCADGTISYSANDSGTCSYHGGVKEWLND